MLNPLWGLRKLSKDIPADLYISAMVHIVRPLIRETGAQTIYLCHSNLWWYMRNLELDFPDRTFVNLNHPSRQYLNWMMKTIHPSQLLKTTWKGEDAERNPAGISPLPDLRATIRAPAAIRQVGKWPWPTHFSLPTQCDAWTMEPIPSFWRPPPDDSAPTRSRRHSRRSGDKRPERARRTTRIPAPVSGCL
jgi:hypothetical protein